MKSGYEEKIVCEQRVTIFIMAKIGSLYHQLTISFQFGNGFFTGKHYVISKLIFLLNSNQEILVCQKTVFYLVERNVGIKLFFFFKPDSFLFSMLCSRCGGECGKII